MRLRYEKEINSKVLERKYRKNMATRLGWGYHSRLFDEARLWLRTYDKATFFVLPIHMSVDIFLAVVAFFLSCRLITC